MPTVASLPPEALRQQLREPGVALDLGACTVRFRARHHDFSEAMRILYGAFPIEPESGFADVSIELRARRRGFGACWAELLIDGESPLESLPLPMFMPLVEWGLNWTIAHRAHAWMILHAGVVAREDRALLIPAFSGAGKSTLTAGLMCNGYRLLSDEFCAIDPAVGHVMPLLRPVCLKNDSIELIARRWPGSPIGPVTVGTRKGTVAHLAPSAASVAARTQPARPEFVVFPRYRPGKSARIEALSAPQAFIELSGNAFNYALLGETAFVALTNLLSHCRFYELTYPDLDNAFALIDALFAERPVTTRWAHCTQR